MADDDALAAIAGELGLALQPLAEATSSADAMQAFLLQLGWDIAPGVALVEAVHASAATVYELVAGGDEGETPDLTALLSGLRAAYVAVADIASGGGGFPADAVAELPRQLADYMVARLPAAEPAAVGTPAAGRRRPPDRERRRDRDPTGVHPAHPSTTRASPTWSTTR